MSIVKIIQMMNADEKRQCALFIASPVFTERIPFHSPGALSRLYAYLQTLSEGDTIDKEVAIAYVYEGKKASVSTLNALSSALHNLIRQYLSLRPHLAADRDEDQLTLAAFYRNRGMTQAFTRTVDQIRERQEATPLSERDVFYYLRNYQLDFELCFFKSSYNTRSGDIHLTETIRSLDIFYLMAKLEMASNLWHLKHITSIEAEEVVPVRDILQVILHSQVPDIPLLRCYMKVSEMILYPGEGRHHFMEFRQLLDQYAPDLPDSQLRILRAHERNFCTRQYAQGHTEYLEVLFDLYSEQIGQGVLYEQGGITASLVQNIVRVALKLGKADWAESFLEAHRYRIVFSNHPEEVYHLYKANIAFEKKDYAVTLHNLRQHYEDNYYIIDANLLELKLYFERRQTNLLLNKLNSFKVNIFKKSKQWLPALRHQAINRFVDILRQMSHDKIIINRQADAIQKLYEKINTTDVIAEREWLLAKLKELSQSHIT